MHLVLYECQLGCVGRSVLQHWMHYNQCTVCTRYSVWRCSHLGCDAMWADMYHLKCQYYCVVGQCIPPSCLWSIGNLHNHCCEYPRSQHSGLLEKGTKNMTVFVCSVHIQTGISESKCNLWILLFIMIICKLEVFCCDLRCSACYMNNFSDASALSVLLQLYGITRISCFRNAQLVSFLMNTFWLCGNVIKVTTPQDFCINKNELAYSSVPWNVCQISDGYSLAHFEWNMS